MQYQAYAWGVDLELVPSKTFWCRPWSKVGSHGMPHRSLLVHIEYKVDVRSRALKGDAIRLIPISIGTSGRPMQNRHSI